MTSRELVRRTVEFDKPERIPRHLWLLPWAAAHYPDELKQIQNCYPNDILNAPACFSKPPRTKGSPFVDGFYVDEWGCTFENRQSGLIGEVKIPLVRTWDDISKVCPPEECLTVNLQEVNRFCRDTDRFVLSGCCPRPFERLQFLRGTQNVLMDLAMQEEGVFQLLDIIHQYNLKELELWAGSEVDALMMMDDWGTQRALLISPDMWRRHFKPLYAEYIQIAHSHNKKSFMHSDGYIPGIILDLIEIGLDALNAQIFCMDIKNLGKAFKGHLTFWGEIDRQVLLPTGNPEEIAAAVQLIYDHLYCNGGVIAQLEFGAGARPENVTAAFESFDSLNSTLSQDMIN